jgi:hypothetical protein
MPAQPARHRPKPKDEQPFEARITVDGKRYVFSVDDASADDAGALRRATGLSLRGLLNAAMEDLDIDVVAALVWLVRRRDEPHLRYEAVAKEIGYSTPIEWADPDEQQGPKIRAVTDDPDGDGSVDPTAPAS